MKFDDNNPRPLYLRILTALLLMPLVALTTIFFGCLSLLAGLADNSGHRQHLAARIWARALMLVTVSPVGVHNAEKLRNAPTAVYVCNHLSYMDTPVLFARLPFQFRIMAKQELWKVPFIGWYLERSGQVPIDASSQRSAVASLLRGVKTLESGRPLVLFPEGGRTPDGRLHPMQSGSAFMAIRAQVPIVPITLVGTYELLPMHTYTLSPRPLHLIIGDPIPTIGLTTRDADALTRQVHDVIAEAYYSYSAVPRSATPKASNQPVTPAFSADNPTAPQPQPDRNQDS